MLKAAEVLDLGAEDQVTELSEGQEDDEEHDSETCQVLGTARQGGGELGHRLVEADVLENLKEQRENAQFRDCLVEWCLLKDTLMLSREDTPLQRTQILGSKYCECMCNVMLPHTKEHLSNKDRIIWQKAYLLRMYV